MNYAPDGDHVRIDISIDSVLKLPGPPPIYKKVAFHDFASVQPQRNAIWGNLSENAKLGGVRNSLAQLKQVARRVKAVKHAYHYTLPEAPQNPPAHGYRKT